MASLLSVAVWQDSPQAKAAHTRKLLAARYRVNPMTGAAHDVASVAALQPIASSVVKVSPAGLEICCPQSLHPEDAIYRLASGWPAGAQTGCARHTTALSWRASALLV